MSADRIYLPFFIIFVVGTGVLIGMSFPAGAWHAALVKPAFNPPNWLFAPVWTTLYVLIAIAGWRVFFRSPRGDLRGLWVLQMLLNFLWSPVFFGLENPALGLVVILALLLVILAFIAKAWEWERISALLFLPYLAWVSFATALNGAIWWLN